MNTARPKSIALKVANAVIRACAAGRNHRPRRKDAKTPYDLYRDRDASPEAAVAEMRAVKEAIEGPCSA